MVGGPVRFALADGEILSLTESDLKQVYELMWQLAPKPGAISVAALIRGVTRANTVGVPIDLDEAQSAAIREAVALLRS
ncbi:MAG TPA: hypothetical protein VJ838_03615 [Gaiellaceae bacterium]|jgi:hypothetical protein|nr:hypothetical protein [Gaiellaceae bacterium]